MATYDDPNNPDPGPTTTDPYVNGPAATNVNAIQQWYQQYFGRQASLDEVNAHLGNPGGLSAVEALIKDSPEAKAYAARSTTPTPTPTGGGNTGNTGGSTGSGTLGDLAAPFTGSFTAPTPTPLPSVPGFTPPPYTPPPAFSYRDYQGPGAFVGPTPEEALTDPGYIFARDAGNNAFMNNRAAAGVAGTGGTIKDFINYNQAAAGQQYTNVWNRDASAYDLNARTGLTTYATNRANALDSYNTNYQSQYKDPWSFADTAAMQAYAPQLVGYTTTAANTQHQNDVSNTNAWNQYLQSFNIFDSQRKFVNQGLQFAAGS